MSRKVEYLFYYISTYRAEIQMGREWAIKGSGMDTGKELAHSDYPHSVYRERSQIEQLAEKQFQIWFRKATTISPSLGSENVDLASVLKFWRDNTNDIATEVKKLYKTGFVSAYQEEVKNLDEIASQPKTPQRYDNYLYNTGLPSGRKGIIGNGQTAAQGEVEATYPLVVRSRSEVEQLGRTLNEKYFTFNKGRLVDNFTDDRKEYDKLYVMGFVSAYESEVAKRDEKAGVKSQPAASAPGVTTTVKGVEKLADEYIYTLEIIDPNKPTQPKIIKYHEEIVEEDGS